MAGFVKPNVSLNRDGISRQTVNNIKCKNRFDLQFIVVFLDRMNHAILKLPVLCGFGMPRAL